MRCGRSGRNVSAKVEVFLDTSALWAQCSVSFVEYLKERVL